MNSRILTDDQIIEIIRRHEAGKTIDTIAKELSREWGRHVYPAKVRYWAKLATSQRAAELREKAKWAAGPQDEKTSLSAAKRNRKHVEAWMQRRGLTRKNVIVPEAKLREFKATAQSRGENVYEAFGKAFDLYLNANENRPTKKGWLNKLIG